MNCTYITGNPEKAKRFSRHLGMELAHQALDIPEIQSLSIDEVVEAKARSAFASLGSPVIVEDTALTFTALGQLPGTFIKFFLDSMSIEEITQLVPADNRTAYCEVAIAYYDGDRLEVAKSHVPGTIAEAPRGTGGFGWDAIFITDEHPHQTMAELSETEYETIYAKTIKPFTALRKILDSLSKDQIHSENQLHH